MPGSMGRGTVALVARALAAALLLWPWPQRAGAAEYVVGDVAFGWDSGVNYAAWAREHAFAVGDVLVFQYVSSQHNVYEVSEGTYWSCDTGGNGVRVKYTSGYDRVVLAEARTYWFICDFPDHCLGGMKVAVNVSAAAGPSPDVPRPSADGSNSNAASLAGEGRRGWVAWGLALGAAVLMN
ncbi:hypothetical protein GQ55_4G011000 [Panicum hallii var. hallii]|uniref:Phytocyanin domain-containing protein n=1 Tax=Panicum hallii var. hallii TaxID=1504633 RepID=A0A2T7DU07_9POAL|nr:hypothetical protein GQ55_4G011000 [Panicum hallii var. hallii]